MTSNTFDGVGQGRGARTRRSVSLSLLFTAFLIVAFVAANARAWSNPGHMAVALVAYRQLDQATRDRVDVLVAMNPKIDFWRTKIPQSLSQAKKKERLFMIAATWADQIKSDGHVNDGNEPPTNGTGGANLGYSDTKMRKYWHYIDLPFSPDGTDTEDAPSINALSQINAIRAVLASSGADDELKSYDLVWLLHLVGDVHQPLHATQRFIASDPDGDAGGNDVKVCDDGDCKTLHSFWDGLFGSTNDLKAGATRAITVANGLSSAPATAASNLDASDWIDESFALAKSSVYKTPVKNGLGTYNITDTYRNNAVSKSSKRIALAGARLANILNAELQ